MLFWKIILEKIFTPAVAPWEKTAKSQQKHIKPSLQHNPLLCYWSINSTCSQQSLLHQKKCYIYICYKYIYYGAIRRLGGTTSGTIIDISIVSYHIFQPATIRFCLSVNTLIFSTNKILKKERSYHNTTFSSLTRLIFPLGTWWRPKTEVKGEWIFGRWTRTWLCFSVSADVWRGNSLPASFSISTSKDDNMSVFRSYFAAAERSIICSRRLELD